MLLAEAFGIPHASQGLAGRGASVNVSPGIRGDALFVRSPKAMKDRLPAFPEEWFVRAGTGRRLQLIGELLEIPVASFFENVDRHPLCDGREGEQWFITRSASGLPVVRHVCGPSSGRQEVDIDLRTFLARDIGSPQHEAAMRLVETLAVAFLMDRARAG